jgi:molybdenum ABC transporter molybdate-binding protein
MRNKLLSIVLLATMLLSAACTAQATATVAPTAVPATAIPATAVPPTATPEPVTLTVLAAASLTEPFTDMGKAFEAAHPGVTVEFSFAGSQALAEQLGQGAAADVFASASKSYMDAAVTANRVSKDVVKNFAMNKLVVIYPKDNPAKITSLADLAKAGIKIDLADETVPVGKYALTFLDNASKDATLGADYKTNVLANVVSKEDNVKAVLTKVSMGEADAGIVYVSDVAGDYADKVGQLVIPDSLNAIASYPIAAISDSKNAEMAQAFVDYVLSADGQATLGKYNFIPAANAFTVTDAVGRKVLFTKAPQRVVLVGKALFMIADAIYTFPEASERVVALGSTKQGSGDFVSMIDPKAADKMTLTGDTVGPEQIAAVTPDLVIMKSSNQSKLGAPLEALGIPVVYVDFETPDQYATDLVTLGQIFQNEDRAKEVAQYYTDKTAAITKVTSALTDDKKPTVLVVYYNTKDNTVSVNVPPLSWIQTTQVIDAGGVPVWKDAKLGNSWNTVTIEQIAAWNPDYIFVVSYFSPIKDVVATLKADPQWAELKAVKDNKIYGFASDVYSWDQADTRWILGLTWMAGKLHPDLFPNLDITAEAKTFYQTLYSIDDATFQSKIVPLFTGDLP